MDTNNLLYIWEFMACLSDRVFTSSCNNSWLLVYLVCDAVFDLLSSKLMRVGIVIALV
jgi:hypothetical protein